MTTRAVDDRHPHKNLVGPALFDAVFSHLAGSVLLDQRKADEDSARAEAEQKLGGPVLLNSIEYDHNLDCLVFGYERAPT
jgi:hypothetical protein